MSSRWLITDEEDANLQGLTTDAQAIYLRVIRRYMDFSTGISAVTYGQMKLPLECLPDRGSQEERRRLKDITNHYVRARIAELERHGVIEVIKKKSRFDTPVFRCVLASTGQIRPDEEPPMNRKGGTAKGAARNNRATARDSEDRAASGTANEPQGRNRKISGIPVSSVSKDTGAGAPEDPAARVWRLWLELVGDTKANRSILGRMISEHGEPEVREAVAATYAKAPADPVAYLRGCLRPKRRFMP